MFAKNSILNFRSSQSTWLIAVVAILVLAIAVYFGRTGKVELCDRQFATIDTFLDEIRSDSAFTQINEDSEHLTYFEPEREAFWSFAESGHPAHPAVVCTRYTGSNSDTAEAVTAVCRAPQAACDGMIAELRERDEKIREEVARKFKVKDMPIEPLNSF